MSSVCSGRLRHRVVIEIPAPVVDEYGQPVKGWTELATVWAGVEPLRGKEVYLRSAEHAKETVRIVMRYLAGVDATCRVVFGSHIYDIHSVINPDMMNRELTLMCSEGLKDG